MGLTGKELPPGIEASICCRVSPVFVICCWINFSEAASLWVTGAGGTKSSSCAGGGGAGAVGQNSPNYDHGGDGGIGVDVIF